jgi:hypothetical protein
MSAPIDEHDIEAQRRWLEAEAESPHCARCGHEEVWHKDGRHARDRLEEGFEGEWRPGPCKGENENRRCYHCRRFVRKPATQLDWSRHSNWTEGDR